MAQATVAVTVSRVWSDGVMLNVLGTLAVSAGPDTYATNGLTVNLNDPLIKAQRAPLFAAIYSSGGYTYYFTPGSNNTNGKLKIFTALGTELGNGVAIPAGNSGDTVTFHARFLGQL
jgi:hypothetical protein